MSEKMTKKFKVNIFYYYAQQYMEKLTEDAEIRNIDMTEEFWKEINEEIKNDELVNININVKVRMGKSTLGIWLGRQLFELLLKHKKRRKGEFGIKNIARDQQEYSKMMRSPETANTVIVTDEINELEQTGENVTVERALNNVFSNVQAARYVHRISCSPKDVADDNADIFLEIVSLDRDDATTHCHLYYKMFKGGNEYMQLLGYVNFNVGDLIDIWENKSKKLFFRQNKTKRDKDLLNSYRKNDFFTEYMILKHEKMELITREGILRPRLLDYAEIILRVEEMLRTSAKMNILNKSTIKNYVKMECRRLKVPTSIIGEELMTQEVDGILSLWKSYFKILKEAESLENKKNKMTEKDYRLQRDFIEKMKVDIMKTIQAQIEEFKRYEEINKKYNAHNLVILNG